MATHPATTAQTRESERKLTYKLIDSTTSVIKAFLKYGSAVWCMSYIAKIAMALAGKTTITSFALSLLGNEKMLNSVLYILAGGGVTYGWGQRRLRRRDIERLTPRPRQLETMLDPNRTSSGLTPRGTTRPEDQ